MLRGKLHADAAIADEPTRLVEHRLAAHLKPLSRAIGIDATKNEIQKWLTRGNVCLQYRALCLIPACHMNTVCISSQGIYANSQHFQNRP